MRLFVTIVLIGIYTGMSAQNANDISKINKIIGQVPDSLTHSTKGIAGYINASFTNPTDKSRAIFNWIAANIQYDVENMYAINFYQNTKEVIDKVLKTKKGVCMHFAELFVAIANQVGIKSYVITGYTKQNGSVDNISHAWCAGYIDSTWYLFDPTWGSGYLQNAKYMKKLNTFYFKTPPEQLIKSHMPFDQLWQLLNYPITNQEFYEGKVALNKSKPFFNYSDTINQYEKETEIEKLKSSSGRIERNGVKNSLVFERLQHIKRDIEYHTNKQVVDKYNASVNLYNLGIGQLNQFIEYRNKQFVPKKADEEIWQMVDTAAYSLNTSLENLKGINTSDSNFATSIVQLNRSIDDAMVNLNEQKTFLTKYFNTGKMFRKSLFYKYTWMGRPLN